jgi:hypothetical protein
MSVLKCGTCKNWYWRYPAMPAPAGYCRFQCWSERAKRKTSPLFTALYYRGKIQQHRREVHGTDDYLAWFDCEGCERIESEYRASLAAAM